MHKEPLHTRFRIAPSGEVHIGHATLAWMSMNAARVTGGTFTMKAQQLFATRAAVNWNKYKEFAHQNLDMLKAIGISPSHPHTFELHGMDPAWRFQLTGHSSPFTCALSNGISFLWARCSVW